MGDRITIEPPDQGNEDTGFRVRVGWAAVFEFSTADLRELVSFITGQRADFRFTSQFGDDVVRVTPPLTGEEWEMWEIGGNRWEFRLHEADAEKFVALIQQCVPAQH